MNFSLLISPMPRCVLGKKESSISRLESLPTEILEKIFGDLAQSACSERSIYIRDHLPISSTARDDETNLLACLLTSKRIYDTCIRALYNHLRFEHIQNLHMFMRSISELPVLRGFVRHLDISAIQDSISSSTLNELTAMLPALVGFKNTHPEADRQSQPETPCWRGLSKLACLEIGSVIKPSYAENAENTEISTLALQDLERLRVLTLHNLTTSILELETMSSFARLTSLTISVGENLWPSELARLLSSHPSLKDSLLALHIQGDLPFTNVDNTTAILASVPDSVRSLDLAQWAMCSIHVPRLSQLGSRLEELRVGYSLEMSEVEEIVLHPNWRFDPMNSESFINGLSNCERRMEHVLRAVNKSKFQQRVNSVSWAGDKPRPVLKGPLRFLGIGALGWEQQACLDQSLLLVKDLTYLEVIEVSEGLARRKPDIGERYSAEGWRTEHSLRKTWIMS